MNGDSMEEKVGYLRAQSEDNKEDLIRIEAKVDKLTEVVEKKFAIAEKMITIVKFMGVVIVAVATFQFGDIKEYWSTFFK